MSFEFEFIQQLKIQNSKFKTQNVMFLEQVIEDYLENYAEIPTENLIFVTPHRRSALFLRQIFAKKYHKATISPEFITLDNLLERISGIKKMSEVQGLFELDKVYKENTSTEIKILMISISI